MRVDTSVAFLGEAVFGFITIHFLLYHSVPYFSKMLFKPKLMKAARVSSVPYLASWILGPGQYHLAEVL